MKDLTNQGIQISLRISKDSYIEAMRLKAKNNKISQPFIFETGLKALKRAEEEGRV